MISARAAALLPIALLTSCSSGNEPRLPPAVSVMVSQGGDVLLEKHHGASAESLYHWWSVTKVATALAILELAEAGRLDLDSPVTRELTWLAGTPDGAAWNRVTPRMLLTHTAGIHDPVPALFGWIHTPGQPQPPEEATLRKAFRRRGALPAGPLPHPRAQYSNLGYVVLGALIERITGRPYGEAVRVLVLEPAGMLHTGVAYPPQPESHPEVVRGTHPRLHPMAFLLRFVVPDIKALVEERRAGRLWFRPVYTDYLGSTGLIGPAGDALRLARHWARREEQSSLKAKALQVRIPGRGSGWQQSTGWAWRESGYFFHRGGGPGFGAELRWYPGEDLFAFAVGNDTTYPYGRLLDREVTAARQAER
jgi:CubicO group peptidase (beta-lactamase class C family)